LIQRFPQKNEEGQVDQTKAKILLTVPGRTWIASAKCPNMLWESQRSSNHPELTEPRTEPVRRMGSKKRKQPDLKKLPAQDNDAESVERLVAKGRLKDAVREAKLVWNKQQSPKNHVLLERAYLLRATQLRQEAMPTAAREVAFHLFQFGITASEIASDAAELFISVGMVREAQSLPGQAETPEAIERFARHEADLTVVRPDFACQAPPEIKATGQIVREAIEALRVGDETKAIESLKDIARNSPFADWKLFVRGLAAHYREQKDDATANWARLDPDRAAAKIIRNLMPELSSSLPSINGSERNTSSTEQLERQTFGTSVLGPLEQLRKALAEDRYKDAIRQIAPLRRSLTGIDPVLSLRLTGVLYGPLILAVQGLSYSQAQSLMREFQAAAQELPIDPHWNRFAALIFDGPQSDTEMAEEYWRTYVKDLETLACLKEDERPLAQALVLNRLAEHFAIDHQEFLAQIEEIQPPTLPQHEIKADQTRIAGLLNQSLKIAPGYIKTHEILLGLYESWNKLDSAAAIARGIVELSNTHFIALTFLANYHFKREEADESLSYAKQARALKPLDEDAVIKEWNSHMLRARMLGLKNRCDEARAELDEAMKLLPVSKDWVHLRARRVAIELKAKKHDIADELIDQSLIDLPDATVFWLALLIESIRYALPNTDRFRFLNCWHKGLSQKVSSLTAGNVSELMARFVKNKTEYPGREVHIIEILEYIRRSSRVKFEHNDLAHVCSLLACLPDQGPLLEKMIDRGLKLFPKSPLFLLLTGQQTLKKHVNGGKHLDIAISQLEKARALAEASTIPLDLALLPEIRGSLSTLKDYKEKLGMFDFPFDLDRGPMLDPDGLDGMMSQLFGLDMVDEDEDGPFGPSSSHSRPKAPKAPRKASPKKNQKKKG
jgi:tetratricopeptide (TPR) repeat protein